MNNSTIRLSGYCAQAQDESDSIKHFHSNPHNILIWHYLKEAIHFWGEYVRGYAFFQYVIK